MRYAHKKNQKFDTMATRKWNAERQPWLSHNTRIQSNRTHENISTFARCNFWDRKIFDYTCEKKAVHIQQEQLNFLMCFRHTEKFISEIRCHDYKATAVVFSPSVHSCTSHLVPLVRFFSSSSSWLNMVLLLLPDQHNSIND